MKSQQKDLILLACLICCFGYTTISCMKAHDNGEDHFDALFNTTDDFIGMLDGICEEYDADGSLAESTLDGKFTVTPKGRMIIVKKNVPESDITYADVESALKAYYNHQDKVHCVYINKSGTITIDCSRESVSLLEKDTERR